MTKILKDSQIQTNWEIAKVDKRKEGQKEGSIRKEHERPEKNQRLGEELVKMWEVKAVKVFPAVIITGFVKRCVHDFSCGTNQIVFTKGHLR